MRAHVVNENGLIINTIEVNSLSVFPNLVDAAIGGGIGDIVNVDAVIPQQQMVALPTIDDYTNAVQNHLDRTAQSRGYDSILSGVSYAGDQNIRFNDEGAAMRAWRSSVWVSCTAALEAVNNGATPPTIQELIDSLPAIVWP